MRVQTTVVGSYPVPRWLYGVFRTVDNGRVEYYTALACTNKLLWIAEARSAGGTAADSGMLRSWGSSATSDLLRERLFEITRVEA